DAAFRAAFAPLLEKLAGDATTPVGVRHSALLALPLLGTERAGAAFRLLADNLRTGRDVAASSRALMQLPRSSWSAGQAGPAAGGILDWAKSIPADQRTDEDFVVTVQAGRELGAQIGRASCRERGGMAGVGGV